MQILPANERVGATIGGRYHLLRLLGVGGFSAVYEATHTITGREVALKLLHPHLVANREVIDRFLQEARAMARIKHEGIVEVLDAGLDDDGSVYIVLELLAGESLEAALLREQRLPWDRVSLYCAQVLDALAEAHKHNIVHRDIKPGNIFVVQSPDGATHARLLDFGVALVAQKGIRITGAGMILGTPEYMSPEQCRTAAVGPASDLWAMGIVMWECLTGATPFVGETASDTIVRISVTDAPPIRDSVPDLPATIASVVDKALMRDLSQRWQSAEDMRDALVRALRRAGGRTAVAASRLASRSRASTPALQRADGDRSGSSVPDVVDLSGVAAGRVQVVSGAAGARLGYAGATAVSVPAPPVADSPATPPREVSSPRISLPPERTSSPPPPREVSSPRIPLPPERASSPPREVSSPRIPLPPDRASSQSARASAPTLAEPVAIAPTPAPAPAPAPAPRASGVDHVAARAERQAPRPATTSRAPEAGLRRSMPEFELPSGPDLARSITQPSEPPPPPVPTPPPAEPFTLPELSEDERAARSFTGDRATFRAPPPDAKLRRNIAALGAAAVALVVVAAAVALRDPAPVVAPTPDTPAPTPTANPPLSFATAFEMPPPQGGIDVTTEFAHHAVATTLATTSQRLVASCVPEGGSATLHLRATTAGALRRSAAGLVRCAGYDLGLVADVSADGMEDVVAVGAAPDTLSVIDTGALRVAHSAPVPGVRGIAAGVQIAGRAEAAVVVYVEPGGPSAPTEVRAYGALSLAELWRFRGDAAHGQAGHPEELGLATGPDANGDGVGDVVVGVASGLGDDASRCVQLVSGSDGAALWPAPVCHATARTKQSLSLGPDVNGDGRADVAVAWEHPAPGEAHAMLLSGADGAVLRRWQAPANASGFGASAALGGDIDGDGAPDLVVAARASVFVFDAATGALRGEARVPGAAAPPRAFAVPPLLPDTPWHLVVASPAEGIRALVRASGAPAGS